MAGFSKVVSIDIDPYMVEQARQNFRVKDVYKMAKSVLANVEDREQMRLIFQEFSKLLGKDYTLTVFNKNSYGRAILESTLRIIEEFGPRNVIYLYQNPIHKLSLLSQGYIEFQRDAHPNNTYKNFKYTLLWK